MRQLILTAPATAVLLIVACPLAAIDPPKDPCRAAQSQLELNRCWSRVANDAERRLTEACKETEAELRGRGAAQAADLLQQAQTKWQDYRDAQCAAVSKLFEGGSMETMQRARCRARLSDQRRSEIEVMLIDWGGRRSKTVKND